MKKPVKKAKKQAVAEQAPVHKYASELTHELRIPTADQYGYMNIQFRGSADDAFAEYQWLIVMVKGGAGLEPKEFNAVLDQYLTTGKISGDPGVCDQMNLDQQSIIQAIKRSRARTNK